MRCPTENRITALSIVGEKPTTTVTTKTPSNNVETWKSEVRPTIICGLSIRSKHSKHHVASVQSLNNQNKEESSSMNIMEVDEQQQSESSYLYLVVYDFQYKYNEMGYKSPEDTEKAIKWMETHKESVSNVSDDVSLEIKVSL